METQHYIITDRVKLNIFSNTYTFEIDNKVYKADWEEPYTADEREEMIDAALEQVAIEFANHSTVEKHDEFLTQLYILEDFLQA